MPTTQLVTYRRAARWSGVSAGCATLVLVISYFAESHRFVVAFYGVGAVIAWGNFIVQTRALRAASRLSAG
jgi:hypothetical protein